MTLPKKSPATTKSPAKLRLNILASKGRVQVLRTMDGLRKNARFHLYWSDDYGRTIHAEANEAESAVHAAYNRLVKGKFDRH